MRVYTLSLAELVVAGRSSQWDGGGEAFGVLLLGGNQPPQGRQRAGLGSAEQRINESFAGKVMLIMFGFLMEEREKGNVFYYGVDADESAWCGGH